MSAPTDPKTFLSLALGHARELGLSAEEALEALEAFAARNGRAARRPGRVPDPALAYARLLGALLLPPVWPS